MTNKKKLGVVLFQLGGPDSPAAVEPFLYNLFCDPDIINFFGAWFARRPLARYIARRRAGVVREHYEAIGGQSPIRLLTERQAMKLAAALAPEFDAQCFVAMRYWRPLTQEAAAAVRDTQFDELVLLPMYPQYSFATTGSSLKEWNRLYRPRQGAPQARIVQNFHTHPLYAAAIAERISTSLRHFDRPEEAHLLFSAHGLPLSLIEAGDPYQKQIEETVQAVMACGKWPNRYTLCYQSPISFVTEHIETLHEINIEARAEALKLGIAKFEMMPAVGDSPQFVAALADLVRSAVLCDEKNAKHSAAL